MSSENGTPMAAPTPNIKLKFKNPAAHMNTPGGMGGGGGSGSSAQSPESDLVSGPGVARRWNKPGWGGGAGGF